MQLTQVGYGGCWKCLHAWQRCSASTPCLAASQNGFVHSFGTGIGLVTRLQSLNSLLHQLLDEGLRDFRRGAQPTVRERSAVAQDRFELVQRRQILALPE